MNKFFTYTFLRRGIFFIYFLVTIIFSIGLIYIGNQEIKANKLFEANRTTYSNKLLGCRQQLNDLHSVFENNLLQTINKKNIRILCSETNKFRNLINNLQNSITIQNNITSNLLHESQRLLSIALTIESDLDNSDFSDKQILLYEGINQYSKSLKSVRKLEGELSHINTWNRKNMFFNKTRPLIIAFLAVITLLSFIASMLFRQFLTRTLKNIKKGTNEITKGNLKYRFTHIPTDEVGVVMSDFNNMATQIERQTKELTRKAEELIKAHRHKDKFLANMSHELRTPLNAVIGFSDIIIHKFERLKPEKNKYYAEKIINASEHLLTLITDLLDVAKADAGVLKPVFSEFELIQTSKNIISMLKPIADKKSLNILFNGPDELYINADKRLISQIMINILNNAIKFTHIGEVKVAIELLECNKVQIKIIDTGIGIKKSEQVDIFKDFHRVETSLTTNYEGTGLGLTLTRRLIELHNGQIQLESKINKGSTFTIILPLKNC